MVSLFFVIATVVEFAIVLLIHRNVDWKHNMDTQKVQGRGSNEVHPSSSDIVSLFEGNISARHRSYYKGLETNSHDVSKKQTKEVSEQQLRRQLLKRCNWLAAEDSQKYAVFSRKCRK